MHPRDTKLNVNKPIVHEREETEQNRQPRKGAMAVAFASVDMRRIKSCRSLYIKSKRETNNGGSMETRDEKWSRIVRHCKIHKLQFVIDQCPGLAILFREPFQQNLFALIQGRLQSIVVAWRDILGGGVTKALWLRMGGSLSPSFEYQPREKKLGTVSIVIVLGRCPRLLEAH